MIFVTTGTQKFQFNRLLKGSFLFSGENVPGAAFLLINRKNTGNANRYGITSPTIYNPQSLSSHVPPKIPATKLDRNAAARLTAK